jgi:hypothetical protein
MAVQLEEYATYAEIAQENNVSRTCVETWVRRGGIATQTDTRNRRKGRLVRREDIEAYLATHQRRYSRPSEPEPMLARWRWECKYCQFKSVRGEVEVCTKFALPQLARVADDGDCVYYGVQPGDLPRPAARDWRVCRCNAEVREGRCGRCGRKVEVEG